MYRISLQSIGRRTHSTPSIPWFVDPQPVSEQAIPRNHTLIPPLPENTPSTLKVLHARLSQSPHLDLSTLSVSQPLAPAPGPPLPLRLPHGRRKRGGTYAGESIYDIPGGIWNWVVMAQVKEGTESKGAIESVMRVVRKTLLTIEPGLPLAPNSKKRMYDGWAMVDGGDFAVHVLSKKVGEKYFNVHVDK